MSFFTRIHPYILKISQPHPSIQEPLDQKKVRYLSISMLIFSASNLITAILLALTDGVGKSVWLLLSSIILTVVCYRLSRTIYYQVGIFISTIAILIIAYGLIIITPDTQSLIVIVFPVFLISLFYSIRSTILVSFGMVISSLVIPLIVEGQWDNVHVSIIFICAFTTIFITNMMLRHGVEKSLRDQTIKLIDQELQLRQAVDMLLENERLKVELEKEHEMNELRGKMMETISHEFRTPLTIIQSSRDILFRYHNRLTPEQRNERLNMIAQQVAHLNNMIARINYSLDDSTTQMSINLAPINLHNMCDMLVKEYQSTLGIDHQLIYKHEGELSVLFLHKTLMRYMLANLISNAIKYSPKGSKVLLYVKAEKSVLTILVRDEGIGILPDDEPHIFEPLYRGQNVGAIGGTGLGLAIVQKGILSHRGTVTIKSETNRYTEVSIQIPLDESYKNMEKTTSL